MLAAKNDPRKKIPKPEFLKEKEQKLTKLSPRFSKWGSTKKERKKIRNLQLPKFKPEFKTNLTNINYVITEAL